MSDRRAHLWLRSKATGPFTVALSPRGGEVRTALVTDSRTIAQDGTMAFTLPDDVPAVSLLAPATAYEFRITVPRTGEMVGEWRFETAPASGAHGHLAFAVMSCHQPFRPDGSVPPDAARMLAALEPALDARGVKYALLIGDQIYADAPRRHSLLRADRTPPLLKASVDEIRACYQARYRRFWALPAVRRLQARRPTWCIWDDHEIVNDWGSKAVHQGAAVALRWPDDGRVYQFVSSAVTNAIRTWKERVAQRLSFAMPYGRHGAGRVSIERLRGTDPWQLKGRSSVDEGNDQARRNGVLGFSMSRTPAILASNRIRASRGIKISNSRETWTSC